MCIYVYVCVCVCVYLCMYLCWCVCKFISVYLYLCMCTCKVHLYLCMHVCESNGSTLHVLYSGVHMYQDTNISLRSINDLRAKSGRLSYTAHCPLPHSPTYYIISLLSPINICANWIPCTLASRFEYPDYFVTQFNIFRSNGWSPPVES